MSTERSNRLGGSMPASSTTDVERHGDQRSRPRDQRDEQQIDEDARRMRARSEAQLPPKGATPSPQAGKRPTGPGDGSGRPALSSRLDPRLAIAHRLLIQEVASDYRALHAKHAADSDPVEAGRDGNVDGDLDESLDEERIAGVDGDLDRPGAERLHRRDADSAERQASRDGEGSAPSGDARPMPTPFSLFGGGHVVPVASAAAPAPALSHLDERLSAMARRLLVNEDQGGGPSVQLELDDAALPGVVVDMFEADGSIVAQFTSRDDQTHDHLAGAAPWLAQSLASALQRDALVRVLADSAQDARPIEVRALPKGAIPPVSPSR